MASEVLKLATFRGDASSVQALLTVASGHTNVILASGNVKVLVVLPDIPEH